MLVEEAFDQCAVADIAFDEAVARVAFDLFEVRKVARIGEQVQVHQGVFGIFLQEIGDEIASDEARAARDQEGRHAFVSIRCRQALSASRQ